MHRRERAGLREPPGVAFPPRRQSASPDKCDCRVWSRQTGRHCRRSRPAAAAPASPWTFDTCAASRSSSQIRKRERLECTLRRPRRAPLPKLLRQSMSPQRGLGRRGPSSKPNSTRSCRARQPKGRCEGMPWRLTSKILQAKHHSWKSSMERGRVSWMSLLPWPRPLQIYTTYSEPERTEGKLREKKEWRAKRVNKNRTRRAKHEGGVVWTGTRLEEATGGMTRRKT